MTFPFENDTRPVVNKLAAASLKHNKLQKHLTVFAIMLATMLMTVVLISIASVAAVNKSDANTITGSYHVLINNISWEQYEALKADERVETIGLSVPFGSSKDGELRLNLSYADTEALALNGLSVSQGNMPKQENEILIEKDYLTSIDSLAGIGDSISLNVVTDGTDAEKDFIISGYLETSSSGTNRTLYAAVVSEQYFEEQGGWMSYIPTAMFRINGASALSTSELEDTAGKIVQSTGISSSPSINEAYLALLEPSAAMIMTAAAALMIIIAAGILVIYNVFYIAILGMVKQLGQLRTVGMTARQIKNLVLREGLVLTVRSIPIGLLVGTIMAYFLVPQGFAFTHLVWAWPLVSVLISCTVKLSLNKPAKIAAGISPIEASRYAALNTGTGSSAAFTKKVTPAALAKKQIRRNKKKHRLTLVSLVLTGVLLLGLSSVLSSLNARDMSEQGFQRGQFHIQISKSELVDNPLELVQVNNPLTADLRKKLEAVTGVESVTEYHTLPVSVNLDTAESDYSMVGFEESDIQLLEEALEAPANLDYWQMSETNSIIVGRPGDLEQSFGIDAQLGQTITLKIYDGASSRTVDFRIVGILDENKIGNNADKLDMLMLPVDAMTTLVSSNTTDQYAVRVSESLEQQAETEIEQILQERQGVQLETLSAAVAQNEVFIQGLKLALMVAAMFIGGFAIMNLINTILTGIASRQNEFALLRSVGMTQKQLTTMVGYECMRTSLLGLVLSISIGGGLGAGLCAILKNGVMNYLHYKFPFEITAVYIGIVLICTIAVTAWALKYQNRQSLVEQLRSVE